MPGVVETSVGYSGGHAPNATYRMVCNGKTGHAEVVCVRYDPDVISFSDLLAAFWEMHDAGSSWRSDPTSQYRSAVYTTTAAQLEEARQAKARLESARGKTLSTEICMAGDYWEAEDYHQGYLLKRQCARGF